MPRKTLLAICLLAGLASAHAQSIFADNFDSDTTGFDKKVFNGGWVVSQGNVHVQGPGFHDVFPGNGNYAVTDARVAYDSFLDKTLNLTGGQYYMASFDISGNPDAGIDIGRIFFGTAFRGIALDDSGVAYHLEMLFQPEVSGDYTLSLTSDTGAPLYDNVDVSAVAPPVPEPSEVAMLLAGLAGMGTLARRRKR